MQDSNTTFQCAALTLALGAMGYYLLPLSTADSSSSTNILLVPSGVNYSCSEVRNTNALASEFHECAKRWKQETGIYSTVRQKVLHPDYQRIIGMGEKAIPLILEDFKSELSHWAWALRAISGEDPAQHAKSAEEQMEAWVNWGLEKQLTA